MKFRIYAQGLLWGLLFLMAGCQGVHYEFQSFTFPNSIPAHEKGWKYKGAVIVSTKESGSMLRRGHKKVTFRVVDEANKAMLDDSFEYMAADIVANISWSSEDNLSIELVERGSLAIDDEYSKQLARTGDKTLDVYVYRINGGEFKGIKK